MYTPASDARSIVAAVPTYTPLLTRRESSETIERGILNLYRRYTRQSQEHRNWHPDTCVDWSRIRGDHTDAVHTIVEGFFGVEQYTPDYVNPLLHLLRRCYGRSQWHIRWGAEEERHADAWRNTVLALGRRDESWIDRYTGSLREKDWRLPWESPLHMVFYQVIQERATQVSYHNFALSVSGRSDRPISSADETLAKVGHLIAAEEAAHYHFFVEVGRLLLYYDPEPAVEAFLEVIRKFTMPARDIMPGYAQFGHVLHETGLFGRTTHYRDVVIPVLAALCLPSLRSLEERVQHARQISSACAAQRMDAYLAVLDLPALEAKVRHLVERNQSHLQAARLSHLFRSDWQQAWSTMEES